ncbi:GNAT family N-acetyltransferase [Alcaligenes ammonioxydans]|uniref:GNAT family N-acetyltransferase n=1 Tax=Alcaligenes ammonioxydans TaxID=2582914 RepID=A0ABX8SW04_9BURK|nr:GNAT family N-acetyltransferase [Alcaligenes ammonioxydans]QBH18059.1 GNAT family N-acetyltransferase [Alcaligenes faecalis]MCH1878424.1 GNAT family N-acetyltransferase [Alcaligenes ammonioxydans]QXX79210.1 GNAT family N-acetyltransferase [Alcaligenes ammonioxydans]WGQ34122.1 GNAT family N-acetyltransferase [Alcaligenes faecalis]HRK85397.1 GNAT family N-acetyltransferase [Alcaligenes faecalis]
MTSTPVFRRALATDLEAIVTMLADDILGQKREDTRLPLARSYLDAFAAIEADPNQYLAVVELDGRVVGTLQISYMPGLSHQGAWRGEIESVRIASSARGSGLGRLMIQWAVEQCRQRQCRIVQLTSDMARTDAHRFYEQLGFTASHKGFKLTL